jgi:hypothetical protein
LSIVSGIDGLAFGAPIGDTAFDSNDIVADLNERGARGARRRSTLTARCTNGGT